MLFKDGMFVQQGQSLIQLDDTVHKAKSDSSKANLLYSETNYKRNVLLGKRGAISQQAIDQALADLKEKQAAAQENQVTLNKMLLVAPFDGVLGKCMVNVGDYVTAGQQLVALTDIKHLRVEYSVPENIAEIEIRQGLSHRHIPTKNSAAKWHLFLRPLLQKIIPFHLR